MLAKGSNSHVVVHNTNDECHRSKHGVQGNTCQVLYPRVDLTCTTKAGEGVVHAVAVSVFSQPGSGARVGHAGTQD